MRKPDSNNQVCNLGSRPVAKAHVVLFNIGLLHRYFWRIVFQVFGTRYRCSRYILRDYRLSHLTSTSLHPDEGLVLRHRKPVTYPCPNPESHPLPRFSYHPSTREITVTFAHDPSYPVSPTSRRESADGVWKVKTYYLSSVPVRKPPTLIDNASALLTAAVAGGMSLFGPTKTNATPDEEFDGQIDLNESDLAEQDRNEAEEIDDSPDWLRPVKAIGLTSEEAIGTSDQAKLRRQWEILPLRHTKRLTGGI